VSPSHPTSLFSACLRGSVVLRKRSDRVSEHAHDASHICDALHVCDILSPYHPDILPPSCVLIYVAGPPREHEVIGCQKISLHMFACYGVGWLRLVGTLKLDVSFAEYRLFYWALLQKRPMILRSLLIVAPPYLITLTMGWLRSEDR